MRPEIVRRNKPRMVNGSRTGKHPNNGRADICLLGTAASHGTETITQPSQMGSWQENVSAMAWRFSSILHDLRNPLTAIYAGAEMLMDLHSDAADANRLAANIHRAAGRMRELLADLTRAARSDRSTTTICDIAQLITAASDAASAANNNHHVNILFDVPEVIELPLIRSLIERVFVNLIGNALEAMPSGGKLLIRAWKASPWAFVEFEDTGPGIPEGIRDRLFDPFVTAGKQDGLGLGLTFSRQTVRDHGGDLWTGPARGARFIMRLPLRHDVPSLESAAICQEIRDQVDAYNYTSL
jgi:signal transduction histidine kinase